MTGTVFCVDIGTSALKAAIIDSTGKVLSSFTKEFTEQNTKTAALEWKKTFIEAAVYFYSNPLLPKTTSVCISGNGPTLVLQSGLTLLWKEEIKQTTSSLFLDRLLFLKNNFPNEWKKSTQVFSGPEFLIYQLTDKALTILPQKEYKNTYWTKELLLQNSFSHSDIKKLPPFCPPGTLAGILNKKIRKEILKQTDSLPQKIKVYTGAPDFISALIGTATLFEEKLCDRSGSSEGLNLCTKNAIYSPGIRTLPSIVNGLWNESVLITESGSLLKKAKDIFDKKNKSTSSWDYFFESTLNKDCEEKIIIDSLVKKIKDAISLLEKSYGKKINEMTVTGAQAESPLWIKYKAKACLIKIKIPQEDNAELLGNAIITFTAQKKFSSLQEAATLMCRIKTSIG